MNTQLIPVVPAAIGNQTVQTVDGRALHVFLAVPTEFSKWIERRIEEYGFEEDKDFSSFLAKSTGGRPTKEYALTLNMGKELAMVERTEIGKQARRYFIECERIALQSVSLPSHDLPVIESSLVLDFQGVPIRFLIDSHGEWMATYADVATALGYVNKEQQYNARNILKYTVKAGQRQLRHPLYGDLINLAGLERVMAQFARNAACMPEPAALAENLKGWLDKTAKSLINQPVSASRLLESPKARPLEIAPIDWELMQAIQVFECWFTVLGDAVLTTRQVIDRAAGTPLAGLLLDIAEGRRSPGVVSSLRLGIWLARRVGWDFDGWVLPPVISRKNDVKRWTLRKVAP